MFSEIKDNLKLFCHVNFFSHFVWFILPQILQWNDETVNCAALPVSRDYDSGVSTEAVLYCLMLSSVCAGGKQGREISPSCFCHSQLIPSRPPPLFSWPTGSDQACSTFYFLFHFNKKKNHTVLIYSLLLSDFTPHTWKTLASPPSPPPLPSLSST